MKRCLTLAGCLLLLVSFCEQLVLAASPCTDPKRVVNGYTVDLRPLMDWWGNSKGVRPLSAWKHLRGNVERETTFGWVVSGKAEGYGQVQSFFLKNPPREKLLKFRELQSKLAQLESARSAALEMFKRPVNPGWFWPTGQGASTPLSITEHRQYEEQLRFIDQEIRATKEQLAPMQDEQGKFRVDVFALRVPETSEGRFVFDYGVALPSPLL